MARRPEPVRAAAAAIVLAAGLGASAQPKAPDLEAAAVLIARATDEARREKGLLPLERNARLEAAAREFARHLATIDRLDHEADGSTPPQRARRAGYRYCFVAENIGFQLRRRGFTGEELAATFVEGWRASPGHRKNLLHPDAAETGVALARSAKSGRYYAVQMFGQPESLAVRFSVANESAAPAEYRVGDRPFRLSPLSYRNHQVCHGESLRYRERTVRAKSGDRFVIVGANGESMLRRR